MEVKEAQNTIQKLSPILPAPSPVFATEGESPHTDVGIEPIGQEFSGKDFEQNSQDEEKLRDAIDEINNVIEIRNIALSYSIDEKTESIVVKVIERPSDKVIRQIPPEEVLRIRGRIRDFLGVIFDENG